MTPLRLTMLAFGLFLAIAATAQSAANPAARSTVCTISINGVIGPATATYVARAIDEAAEQNAQCLIIQLDTPGGLLESTKRIVQSFLASPIPTVVYVSPPGATATSAGCFITMASDVAAMAPATSIGAAHPVQIGGEGSSPPDDIMKKKLENYAASYIETIAARHKRNVQWAISAVRESASIPAEKAKELNVIEIIAADMPDLLSQLDGRTISNHRLSTAGAQVTPLAMTLREKSLHLLGSPEVMFILMLIAIYGIIGELSNPGAILPGVAGAIAVILMLYLGSILPINLAGLALVALAIGLFIADAFATTHGVLTVGGIIAFFLGVMMTFDRGDPVMRLSLWFVVPGTLLTALFFVAVVGAGLRAQFKPKQTGHEAMVGMIATTVTAIDPATAGRVSVEGEYWNAISNVPIEAGRRVRIAKVATTGLTLTVEPAKEPDHG